MAVAASGCALPPLVASCIWILECSALCTLVSLRPPQPPAELLPYQGGASAAPRGHRRYWVGRHHQLAPAAASSCAGLVAAAVFDWGLECRNEQQATRSVARVPRLTGNVWMGRGVGACRRGRHEQLQDAGTNSRSGVLRAWSRVRECEVM
jgi:hypothetical protein